jgi:protein-tyrosine phosphatase
MVSDRLTVGRRLLAREGLDGFANYIDLTAEFSEPRALRARPDYVAFPILDASAPSPEQLYATISNLRTGKTYIHCAQGHGRTGLFAAALLLSNDDVGSVEEALSFLVKARPAIRLNDTQLSCLTAFATMLSARRVSPDL